MNGSVEPQADGLARCLALTAAWPETTLVVRGDSAKLEQLQEALVSSPHPAFLPRLHGWSVQAKPLAGFEWLCQPLVQSTVRVTTLGAIRSAGGDLAKTRAGTSTPRSWGLTPRSSTSYCPGRDATHTWTFDDDPRR